MGTGSATKAVGARIRRLGLTERVRLVPHERDRDALAAAYRSARCVVMPGEFETFGLVAFEAAACGAATVACTTAPSARLLGASPHTFAPGDPRALLAAIERARAARARPPRRRALRRREPLGARVRRRARRPRGARRDDRRRPLRRSPLDARGDARPRGARGRDARRRARHVRALRADPRLARRPRRRAGDAAGDPRAAAAPVPRPLAGARELAARPRRRRATRSPSTASSTAARARRRGSRARCAAGRAAPPPSTPGLDAEATVASVEAGRNVLDRRRAARRAGSSRPATPTRARCASTWRRASTGGRRCSRCAATRSASAPALCLGTSDAAQARDLARAGPRRRGALRAACCGSTCTPPTSTTRATCSRVERVLQARAAPRRGHLRRPVLNTRRRPSCARTGARASAATARRSRSPARRRGATSTSGTGTRCFHAIAWTHIDRAARASRSCARCCAPAARTASSRTPRSGRRSPRWRRAPLYATAALPRRHRRRSRSRRRCWRSRGSGSRRRRRVPRGGPRAAGRARPLADRASATPTATACSRSCCPTSPASTTRPSTTPSTARSRTDKPGYARLVQRCRRARWNARDARPHHRRARRGRAGQRRARALAARAAPHVRRARVGRARRRAPSTRCSSAAGTSERGLFFDLAGRARAPRRGLDLVVAGAARARRRIPREIRERLADEHLLQPAPLRRPLRRPVASRWRSRRFRPGFNAYRTWRGAAWVNTAWLLIGGLRALGRRTTRPTGSPSGVADAVERSGFREYYHPRTGSGHGEHRFGFVDAAARPPAGFSATAQG